MTSPPVAPLQWVNPPPWPMGSEYFYNSWSSVCNGQKPQSLLEAVVRNTPWPLTQSQMARRGTPWRISHWIIPHLERHVREGTGPLGRLAHLLHTCAWRTRLCQLYLHMWLCTPVGRTTLCCNWGPNLRCNCPTLSSQSLQEPGSNLQHWNKCRMHRLQIALVAAGAPYGQVENLYTPGWLGDAASWLASPGGPLSAALLPRTHSPTLALGQITSAGSGPKWEVLITERQETKTRPCHDMPMTRRVPYYVNNTKQ